MPGKVKVKIISGRNLPVMDRSSDTTDAYVEVKLGPTIYKTDVCRKSLNPQWNSEWYRFEADDSELQDEPLQIRLMDHDTYSANDAIGKVYLNLNPLLHPAAGQLNNNSWNSENNTKEHIYNSIMSGWIPVYDTMHGIRGEVNVIVKVELFSDFNRFRQSSCGVQFFCALNIPQGFHAQVIHGFVEELLVYDDPEYQWIDKIRTPRASNEARQMLFFKLSGELQRKIGVKALELGANAVVGYRQCFDLEGESGIVARGIGTVVTLVKSLEMPHIFETVNEEEVKGYLKFVGSASSFRLNAESNLLFKTPSLIDTTNILPSQLKSTQSLIRQTLYKSDLRPVHSNPILTGPHLSLKNLLEQEDMRSTPSSGITQKIKNLKYSSRSILSKKMSALKAKIGDEDSEGSTLDLAKKRKRFAFKKAKSDPSVMAQLLACSVINTHTYLSSILEAHDAAPVTVKDREKEEDIDTAISYDSSVRGNAPEQELSEHNSDVSIGFNISSSSIDSASSECDDEDDNTYMSDTELDIDTVSNIVKNVELGLNHSKKFLKQLSLPALPNYEKSSSAKAFDLLTGLQTAANQDLAEENKVLSELNNSQPNDAVECSNIEILPEQNFRNSDLILADTGSNRYNTDLVSIPITSRDSDASSSNIYVLSESNSRVSVAPAMIISDFERQSLVKTAMQTILLEKVNIMGTYTPPISPTCFSSPMSSPPLTPLTQRLTEFRGKFNDKPVLTRSLTNLSLIDYYNHDSVLGIPFQSTNNIKLYKQQSHPNIYRSISTVVGKKETVLGIPFQSLPVERKSAGQACFSDSELNKPISEFHSVARKKISARKSADNILKRRFSFLPRHERKSYSENLKTTGSTLSIKHFSFLRRKTYNSRQTVCNTNLKKQASVSSDELHKKKFNLLPLVRKTSESGGISPKTPTKELTWGLPHIFRRSKTMCESKNKSGKRGLLESALGNVVGGTVQDILATSHCNNSSKEQITSSELPFSPPDPSLNHNNSPISIKNDLPGTTEKDTGITNSNNMHASLTISNRFNSASIPEPVHREHIHSESGVMKVSQSPGNLNNVGHAHRRSSDSDLSITPKGNSLTGSDKSTGWLNGHVKPTAIRNILLPQEKFDVLKYPFLTMSKFPSGFIIHLGGAVSARSVKVLERINNIEEPETRDTWWSELRMEIRSHANALNCNAILGYSETTTICEDVCVLSASGTAAVIGMQTFGGLSDSLASLLVIARSSVNKDMLPSSLEVPENDKEKELQKPTDMNKLSEPGSPEFEPKSSSGPCSICHIPYDGGTLARGSILKCVMCRKGSVPDVLITTIEAPDEILTIGRGCFLQTVVSRPLRDGRGEANAKEISDGLPFLEYELHRLLLNKLKIKGMNAIFGLKTRISIGEKIILAVATGTAVFLASLHSPVLPRLVSDRTTDEGKLVDLRRSLFEMVRKNREIYQLRDFEHYINGQSYSDEDSDVDSIAEDLLSGTKDCILEVDDPDDAEVVKLMIEERPPDGFHVVSTEFIPGLCDLEVVKNLQMFKQVYRAKIQHPYHLHSYFQRLLQSVYFKLRRMIPCALCNLQFCVDLPEPEELQLTVLGMALGLGEIQKPKHKSILAKSDDLIFSLDEDVFESSQSSNNYSVKAQKTGVLNQSLKQKHLPHRERYGVDITPLSYVPGAKIERYLGNLNFFFIRETTSIREEGGLSGFIHSFATEVLAIVRAHVTALGGNAMTSYFLNECLLHYNLHKNQGQCLINVGGDVVFVRYPGGKE